jgi:hypothetical protein
MADPTTPTEAQIAACMAEAEEVAAEFRSVLASSDADDLRDDVAYRLAVHVARMEEWRKFADTAHDILAPFAADGDDDLHGCARRAVAAPGENYATGHSAGDRARFTRCKEDIARALGMATDTEWGVLVAKVRTLESALRRYEPRVGDRVTWENVRELREGRRVTWTTPDGKVATATKQDDDVWCIDGTTCCITDSAIVGEHGGPPTFILSLPPEAPNADRS